MGANLLYSENSEPLKSQFKKEFQQNSKTILKNVKFGLQVHLNMEIMLSDRFFGLEIWRYLSIVRKHLCYA